MHKTIWCARSPNQLQRLNNMTGYHATTVPGPLFIKWMDVLSQYLVMFQSREIGCYNDHIALKLDRLLS